VHPDLQPPDERVALEQRLDQYRGIVASQLSELTDEQAARGALPASNLTAGGIVKHLAWAEDLWFQERLRGIGLPEPWASAPLDQDRDWPFTSAATDGVEAILDLYGAACARSREAANECTLDTVAARSSFGAGPVNLRWLLVHMIDETARHAGHLDLLVDALRSQDG